MQVSIKDIKISDTRRAVDPLNVGRLAESIQTIGLQNPVVITEDYHLVSGRHRLEAVKSLGRDTIEANVLPLSSEGAELAEIDENLIRKEVTGLERGTLMNRRDELLTAMGVRAKSGDNQFNKEVVSYSTPPKTTKEIAAEIGIGERQAQRMKQVARDIIPEVKAMIQDTPMADRLNSLVELSRKTPEQQKAIGEVIKTSRAMTVREAETIINPPKEKPMPVESGVFELVYADLNLTKDMKNPLKDFQIAENATLFLWALEAKLDIALDLGRAWGFKYRAGFVWDKRFDTQGPYHRRNHAHLLIFVKGKHEPTMKGPDWGSIWSSDAETFAIKPEAFKQVVSDLFDGTAILEI